MSDLSGIDWEDAFANASYINGGNSYPEVWARQAALFRAGASAELEIPYGSSRREKLDLFYPSGMPRGLAVFVHGGYWLDFDKSSWSHLASGALDLDWAVAVPSYPLAPHARICEITSAIGRAIAAAAERVGGSIHLVGHSAGGHLVTRMVCEDTPLRRTIRPRVKKVISISGLHDLRPLQAHSMNQRLGLRHAEALAESPALQPPGDGVQLLAWVGGEERPEFLRQSALLVERWRAKGARTKLVVEGERHHFNVIEGLADGRHPLAVALAGSGDDGSENY